MAEIEEKFEEIMAINIDKYDCHVALNRFLYLGTIERSSFVKPFEFNYKSMLDTDTYFVILKIIKKQAETNPSSVVNLIKKAVQSELCSSDAVLCCLIICLCESSVKEELKKEVRSNFSEFLPSPKELLRFMARYAIIKNSQLNFGRGMRNVLFKWYDKRTENELVEILASEKVKKNISHQQILKMAHVSFQDGSEKSKIVKLFQSDFKSIDETSEIEKKISFYRKLKKAANIDEVLEILSKKDEKIKCSINRLPPFAKKSITVMETILPIMNLCEILENINSFCSHKMLRVQEPISKKICIALNASNKILSESKLYPIYIFEIMRGLEKRLTITNVHKNGNGEASSDNHQRPERQFSNPYIIKKMQNLFTQSMNVQSKTGCRFYVTVDFKKFSKRQSNVYGMPSILCSELQAIIALTLLKTEKEVTVMSFSESNSKLKSIEWNGETSYEKAMEIYNKEIIDSPKTKESPYLPIQTALKEKKKVDVFITFVSSLGRSMGSKGKVDHLLTELKNYRQIMNLNMTKYIVINMTRKKPDLHYDNNNVNEKGILEIVGFAGVSTMKVIEAFIKNNFS